MKKFYALFIITIIALCGGKITWGQETVTVINEGFEGGAIPTGWTQIYDNGSISRTVRTGANDIVTSAYRGSYNAFMQSSIDGYKTKLCTPIFDLSDASSATLTFYHAQPLYSPDNEELRVYYRTTSTGTWTLVTGGEYTSSVDSWTVRTLSIPTNAVQIGFQGTTDWGYGVIIDDILLTKEVPTPGTPTTHNVPKTDNDTWTTCDGRLYDHAGPSSNYANNCNGYTVIYPETPGSSITIQGTYVGEGGYDYLKIYDGVGTGGTLLGNISSSSSGTTMTVGPFTVTSGAMTVQFTSDGSNEYAGFDLQVTSTCTPPSTPIFCGVPLSGSLTSDPSSESLPLEPNTVENQVHYNGYNHYTYTPQNSGSYYFQFEQTSEYEQNIDCDLIIVNEDMSELIDYINADGNLESANINLEAGYTYNIFVANFFNDDVPETTTEYEIYIEGADCMQDIAACEVIHGTLATNHENANDGDDWYGSMGYLFTPTSTGEYSINFLAYELNDGEIETDLDMWVYNLTTGLLEGDEFFGVGSTFEEQTFTLSAGTTYLLQVKNYSAEEDGVTQSAFDIYIESPSCPRAVEPVSPTALTCGSSVSTTLSTTAGATQYPGACRNSVAGCHYGQHFYTITGKAGGGDYAFRLTNTNTSSLQQPMLYIYQDEDACNYIFAETAGMCELHIDEGETYTLLVMNFDGHGDRDGATSTSYELEVVCKEPAVLPYSHFFGTDAENNQWLMVSNSANMFTIGTAANNTNNLSPAISGQTASGLYITNGTAYDYTYTTTTNAYAYRSITFPAAGQYFVSFDYQVGGSDATNDYMLAFLANSTYSISTYSALTAVPASCVDLYAAGGKISNTGGWKHNYKVINVPTAGTYNIIFYWRNNASTDAGNPGAIDNLRISKFGSNLNCGQNGEFTIAGSAVANYMQGRTNLKYGANTYSFAPATAGMHHIVLSQTQNDPDFSIFTSKENSAILRNADITGGNADNGEFDIDLDVDEILYITVGNNESNTQGKFNVTVLCSQPEVCNNGVYGGEVSSGECLPETTATSTSYQFPVNNNYNRSYTQTIYKPEMLEAGNINSISYKYAYSTALNLTDVYIYMTTTTKNNYASAIEAEFVSPANQTLVYSGAINFPANSWKTINLTTPFYYDGTENLVVTVVKNQTSYHGTSYVFSTTKALTDAGNVTIYRQNDGSGDYALPPNPISSYGTVYVSAYYPDTKFCVSPLCMPFATTPSFANLNPSITFDCTNENTYSQAISNLEAGTNVTYCSSNTDIATIDENGLVTILSCGTTTISANITKHNYCSEKISYTLTINPSATPPVFSPNSTQICNGQTLTLPSAGEWSTPATTAYESNGESTGAICMGTRHYCDVVVESGSLKLTPTSADPYVRLNVTGFSASDYHHFVMRYKAVNPPANPTTKLYWSWSPLDTHDETEQRQKEFSIIGDDEWHTIVVDLEGVDNWSGTITEVRVDPFNTATGYNSNMYLLIDYMAFVKYNTPLASTNVSPTTTTTYYARNLCTSGGEGCHSEYVPYTVNVMPAPIVSIVPNSNPETCIPVGTGVALHAEVEGVPINFEYTGGEQTWTVPEGVTKIKLEVWGAQGGYRSGQEAKAGKGGYTTATINVQPDYLYYVNVGGSGNTGGTSGGYNGGGTRTTYPGGGGATHIATASGLLRNLSGNQASVVVVAGGGGSDGGTGTQYGGAGGGASGIAASGGCYNSYVAGGFGYAGSGSYASSGYGGAGGGGWTGGRGVIPDGSVDDDKGGDGGSGYFIPSAANTQTIAGNTTMPNPAGGEMTGRSGNGYARITPIYASDIPTDFNWTLNGIAIAQDIGINAMHPYAENEYIVEYNDDFCGWLPSDPYVIYTQPNPNITKNPSRSIYCPGNSVTLTANPSSEYNYAWSNSVSGASNLISNLNGEHTGTYTVTVSSNATCSATATASIYVEDIQIELTSIDDIACLPTEQATLKAGISFDFEYTGGEQTWTVPEGVTEVTLEVWGAQGGNYSTNTGYGGKGGYSKGSVSVTPGQTIYVYIGGVGQSGTSSLSGGTDSGGGGGSGYIGGVSNAVTIAGNATMPNPEGGKMVGREGHGYARITYYPATGSMAWYEDGSQISGATASTYTATPPAMQTEYYSTYNSGNCQAIESNHITVYKQPQGIITANPDKELYCIGSTLELSVTADGTAYSWDGPNAIAGGSNPNAASTQYTSLTPENTGTYMVTVQNGLTCNIVSSQNITIHDLSVEINSEDNLECIESGSSVTLSVVSNDLIPMGAPINFDYTNGQQTVTVPEGATHAKLEVWGAQGGDGTSSDYNAASTKGGRGGFSKNTVKLNDISTLYVVVGGAGTSVPVGSTAANTILAGGYNGGGYRALGTSNEYGSSGGGATHIATMPGILSSLSGNKSSVLIVAGGGGGHGEDDEQGGYGGGTTGGQGSTQASDATAGNQNAGGVNSANSAANGSFGQGGNTIGDGGGGGGGWYGGASPSSKEENGNDGGGGSGGSGYVIDNSSAYFFLDAENQTIAGNTSFAQPDGSTAVGRSGNGYARITFLHSVPGAYAWSTSETTQSINPTPASYGSNIYTVTFTAESECTATATKDVTVGPRTPILSATNGTITDAPFCQNENITISNTTDDGYNYSWYTAPITGFTGATNTIVNAQLNAGTTYRVTASQGSCTASGELALTIKPTPVVEISTPDNLCITSTGTNVELTASNDLEDGGAVLGSLGTPTEFNYTNAQQTYTVPAGAIGVLLEVWGAQGGDAIYKTNHWVGGKGGYSKGTITVTPSQILYINVGGQGTTGNIGIGSAAGGFNGGGGSGTSTNSDFFYAGGGGGATDIRSGGDGLANRIIVAGGGGGASYGQSSPPYNSGGDGGGISGIDGYYNPSFTTRCGKGATSSNGGVGGTGGASVSGSAGTLGTGAKGANGAASGAGGGGGYYGGGSGADGFQMSGGGGGGSAYITGLTDAQTIAGNATMPNPEGGEMTGREGNGYARITPIFPDVATPSFGDYTWTNNGSTVGETSNIYNVSPDQALNTYTASITIDGCTGTGEIIIPVVNAESLSVADENVCIGMDYSIVENNLAGADVNYYWSTNGTDYSLGTNTKELGNVFNPQRYYLKVGSEGRAAVAGTATFAYTGSEQTWTVPEGVTEVTLEVWGAQGGNYSTNYGGKGGYSKGTISVTSGQILYVNVGGQPATNSTNRTKVTGGYNGGGNGFNRDYSHTSCGSIYTYGQGGGGATHIATETGLLSSLSSNQSAVLIVAGGGGGSASNGDERNIKYGGGESGGSNCTIAGVKGGQNSVTAGANITAGTFGQGANCTTTGSNYQHSSGGGGGGWYGGGACSAYGDCDYASYRTYNGGGSGYIGGVDNGVILAGNQSMPSTSGTGTITGREGHGYARISYDISAIPECMAQKEINIGIKQPTTAFTSLLNSNDILWTGYNSINWNEASNWLRWTGSSFTTTSTYPQNTTHVAHITQFASDCVSNMPNSSSNTINTVNIHNGGTLNSVSANFSVSQAINVNTGGAINQTGGTLTAHDLNLLTGATFDQNGGTVNPVNMNIAGGTFNHNYGSVSATDINNYGTINDASGLIRTVNFTNTSDGSYVSNGEAMLNVNSNFTNDGTFTANGGQVAFISSGDKTLSGSGSTNFYNFMIQADDGAKLTIDEASTATVNNIAYFERGKVYGNLTFGPNASSSVSEVGTPDAPESYLIGMATKIGNGAGASSAQFTFPVGSEEHYAPVTAKIPAASTIGVTYAYSPTEDPVLGPPTWDLGDNLNGVESVSDRENWQFHGTGNIYNLKLHWYAGQEAHLQYGATETPSFDDLRDNLVIARTYYDFSYTGEEEQVTEWSPTAITFNHEGTVDKGTISMDGVLSLDAPADPSRAAVSGKKWIITFGTLNYETLPLPIELLVFDGECYGTSADLFWTTASEKNNEWFVVEKSADAVNFVEIARIHGAGNSIEELTYNYTDENVLAGNNYYRLRQIDYDGKSTTSDIISLDCGDDVFGGAEPAVKAYPNPFHDNITVVVENMDEEYSIELYNELGQRISAGNLPDRQVNYMQQTTHELHLSNLPPATYYVRITSANHVLMQKIVKQ